MDAHKPVGQTTSQGWQVGVRRTLPVSEQQAWQMMLAVLGLAAVTSSEHEPFARGATVETDDGTRIEVRSCTPNSLLRMRWQPKDWTMPSTLQLRVLPAKTGTTISIHHEWLQDAEQREAMRVHWTNILDTLNASLAHRE
jgi:uncharacterized protein YndB with AHSA1/START domain